MPIYAYKCSACGHEQDVLQKMSDPVLTDCPQCKQSTYVKQVTAAGFQLKGTGWYVTDFRDNNRGKSASTESKQGAAGQGGASISGSSDSGASSNAGSGSGSSNSGPGGSSSGAGSSGSGGSGAGATASSGSKATSGS